MSHVLNRIVGSFPMLIIVVVLTIANTATNVCAATIFESGTLGPVGIAWSDFTSGAVPASTISPFVFTGVRFHLDQPAIATQVGGHFAAPAAGTFFGAVVALDDSNDFPDSSDLSTPDVLGHALLNFTSSSAEVFGVLSLSLDTGWYALVFGSGLYGAVGSGGAPANNPDIGEPTYIAVHPGSGVSWIDLATFVTDLRFVVKGTIVPEPSTPALVVLAMLITLATRQSK